MGLILLKFFCNVLLTILLVLPLILILFLCVYYISIVSFFCFIVLAIAIVSILEKTAIRSEYFSAKKYLFLNLYFISQNNKRDKELNNCRSLSRILLLDLQEFANKIQNGKYYITLTHEPIINRLERGGIIDYSSRYIKKHLSKSSLKFENDILINKNCKKCSDYLICKTRLNSLKKRDFYLVIFKANKIDMIL